MKYQVGKRVTGKVSRIDDLGIFLILPDHQLGLIHHNDFGNNWLRSFNRIKIGDKLRVVVIHVYKNRLELSLSRVNDPNLIDHSNQFAQVKASDFADVLNKTLYNAKREIKNLKEVLNNSLSNDL